jgi:FAD/FMN-containing dehydrogenase
MPWQPRAKTDLQLTRLRTALERAPDGFFDQLGMPADALEELQRCMEGPVLVPGVPGYEEARWRGSHYPDLEEPLLIAMCEVVPDVACCLSVAKKYDIDFAPRSGGHSTVGYGVKRGMVVDLSPLHGVLFTDDMRHVRVQAGANLSKVYRTLEMYGLHIPGGECDTVGVAGHMQGGGYGFTSREFGLNCDRVDEVSVMLADGRVVRASESEEPDLFWAVRGGTGNNFGVLLEVRYRVAELGDLWGGTFLWPLHLAPDLLVEIQKRYIREGSDPKLGFQLAFSTYEGERSFVLMAMYNGSEEDGRSALERLFEVHEPHRELISTVERYFDLNRDLIESFYPEPPPRGTFEFKSSAYIDEPLGVDGWREIVEQFATTPNHFNVMAMEVYGGRIADVDPQATAFVHRHAYGDLFVDSFYHPEWSYNTREDAERWLRETMEVIDRHSNGRRYQNYPERGLQDPMDAYFGENLERLRDVKKAYDPESFFRFEQSIPPAE